MIAHGTNLIHAVPKPLIAAWRAYGTEGCYREGEALFYQQHNPYGIFIILAGTVVFLSDESKNDDHGSIIGRATPDQMLGLTQLLNRIGYPVSAVAEKPVQVLFIEKNCVLRLHATQPQLFSSRIIGTGQSS